MGVVRVCMFPLNGAATTILIVLPHCLPVLSPFIDED
jgi:hypothetical protein